MTNKPKTEEIARAILDNILEARQEADVLQRQWLESLAIEEDATIKFRREAYTQKLELLHKHIELAVYLMAN